MLKLISQNSRIKSLTFSETGGLWYGALISEVWPSNYRFSDCGFEKFKLCPIQRLEIARGEQWACVNIFVIIIFCVVVTRTMPLTVETKLPFDLVSALLLNH